MGAPNQIPDGSDMVNRMRAKAKALLQGARKFATWW